MSDQPKQPQNVARLPSKDSFKRLAECKSLQEAFQTTELKSLISQAIPKFMDADTMLRTWVQATSKNPLILKADMRQALGMFQALAFLGLPPNTPLGLAHIIPFNTKKWNPKTRQRDIEGVDLQMVIGYPGYIELGYRSGVVAPPHADVVYNKQLEGFEYSYGSNQRLVHNGMPHDFRPGPDQTPQYAYAHTKMRDGSGEAFEVMPWWEVESIRDGSQGYKAALWAKNDALNAGKKLPPKWTEAPWVKYAAEMGKKTPVRRLYKWLPRCPELRAAAALEDAQDRNRLDFGPVIDGTASPFDGIPEAEPDGPPPAADPAAAFQDRRPTETPPKADPKADPEETWIEAAERAERESRGETAPVANQKPKDASADNRRKPPETPPAFEAILIDRNGEPLNGPPLTSARSFATAFMMLWREAEQAEDADGIDALREHNADSIEEAKQTPDAAELLAEMDEADPGQTKTPTFDPIVPPVERGKVAWPSYIRLLKIELGNQPVALLEPWAEAQHETLTTTPMAQRIIAIRAVAERMGAAGITPPGWLADLMRPPAKPQQATPEPEPQADPQSDSAEAPPPPPPEQTADERWVAKTIEEIKTQDRAAFDAFIKSPAVRSLMARLQRENLPLFDKADIAFLNRHRALPAAPGNGGGK